jgi:hypothetical protein
VFWNRGSRFSGPPRVNGRKCRRNLTDHYDFGPHEKPRVPHDPLLVAVRVSGAGWTGLSPGSRGRTERVTSSGFRCPGAGSQPATAAASASFDGSASRAEFLADAARPHAPRSVRTAFVLQPSAVRRVPLMPELLGRRSAFGSGSCLHFPFSSARPYATAAQLLCAPWILPPFSVRPPRYFWKEQPLWGSWSLLSTAASPV